MSEIYSGTVIKGDGRGKTIGFPTANIDLSTIPQEKIDPGVYGSTVTYNDTKYKAILFFGPKKTFDRVENTLEIYILEFDQDIYGEELSFTIEKFIRGPIKFTSVDELVAQIKEDISQL